MRRVLTVVNRASPGPLLVRCAVFLGALGALAVALPSELFTSRAVVAIPLLAVWPAVAPRGRGATAVALVAVAGWLLATSMDGRQPRLLPLVTLAALVYLTHSLAALAAVLPYDVVVAPEAVVRWLARTGLVVVFATALAVAALGVAGVGVAGAGVGGTSLAAVVAGAAVALGLAALLAWLVRRR
jgi:hypothetical protein